MDSFTERMLAAVNEFRTNELGLPRLDDLPKGVPGHSGLCPVARALISGTDKYEVRVDHGSATVYRKRLHFGRNKWSTNWEDDPNPRLWINSFDAGNYPEYEL